METIIIKGENVPDYIYNKIGNVYGKLQIINYIGYSITNNGKRNITRYFYDCLCDCGRKKTINSLNICYLKRSKKANCGMCNWQDYSGDFENEIWKTYNSKKISNYGRVMNEKGFLVQTGIAKGGQGYHYIDGEKRSRIVYNLFVGEIPEGLFVNHIDGNKVNDNINNLELATPTENIQHAYNTGLNQGRGGYRADFIQNILVLMSQEFSNLEIHQKTSIKKGVLTAIRKGRAYRVAAEKYFGSIENIPKSHYVRYNEKIIISVLEDIYKKQMNYFQISKKYKLHHGLIANISKNLAWNQGRYLVFRKTVETSINKKND